MDGVTQHDDAALVARPLTQQHLVDQDPDLRVASPATVRTVFQTGAYTAPIAEQALDRGRYVLLRQHKCIADQIGEPDAQLAHS